MNTPNPLMPQGALSEQKPKNKTNIIVAVFAILTFHVLLLGALLLQGCKDRPAAVVENTVTNLPALTFSNPPPLDTASAPLPPAPVVAVASNPATSVLPPAPALTTLAPVADMGGVTSPATLGGTEHAVAKGDSFAGIAKKYGVSVSAIEKANPGVDSRKLKINQKIKIPEKAVPTVVAGITPAVGGAPVDAAPAAAGNIYVVKPGDNLIKIAKTHGVSVKQIKTVNHMSTDRIAAGKKLKIPVKAAGVESAPAPAPAAPVAPVAPASAGLMPSADGGLASRH